MRKKLTRLQREIDKSTITIGHFKTVLSVINRSSSQRHQFSSVQSLSFVRLFTTPWTAECQASQSTANSQSLLKLMSIESVVPSNHLILCHPLLLQPSIFPSIRVFSYESVLTTGGQSIGVSASASVLPMNIQDWFPLGLIGLISLQSKWLSRVFSSTTIRKLALSLLYGLTLCNFMDHSLPGSSVHGVLQARILEWVAILFSKGCSQPRYQTWVSCTAGKFFIIWITREAPKTPWRKLICP